MTYLWVSYTNVQLSLLRHWQLFSIWVCRPALCLMHGSTLMLYQYIKKGDKCKVDNYRPISLLNSVSKIMVRLVFNHVYHSVHPNMINSSTASLKIAPPLASWLICTPALARIWTQAYTPTLFLLTSQKLLIQCLIIYCSINYKHSVLTELF